MNPTNLDAVVLHRHDDTGAPVPSAQHDRLLHLHLQ